MKPIKYDKIEVKIANLIKAKIKQKGLVKTGKMLNSIKVSSNNGGFTVTAIDYFYWLDAEYHITDEVFASQAFVDLIVEEAGNQISDQIIEGLK